MKVPLSWLKEYIPLKLSPEEIATALTLIGLEVEGIHDAIFEVALTPNLAHCASIRGVARELSAVTQEPMLTPKFSVVERSDKSIQNLTSVHVENPTACPRYACRLITDVRVAPSPEWLKERIEQCGMRSVNNVVDITNLVLLEMGQPLHAFDLDRLSDKRIVVRNAKKEEKIITLDGKEHYPSDGVLLICDAQKPIAIAGIMGSAETEVSEKTTTILLESAFFDPAHIRRATKQLEIRSEASYRFERGTDPNGVIEALNRAAFFICTVAGGVAARGILDIHTKEFSPSTLFCRLKQVNRLLGTHLALSEVETIFRRLGLEISEAKDELITVRAPTYRHDIKQEIDLIEEVARLYGYGNLHKKEKASFHTGSLLHSPEYLFSKRMRSCMLSEGLQEFLTCDLISPHQANLISTDNFPSRTLIKLLNPHSADQSIMRPSMLPGMLSVVKFNADHGIYSIHGFEIGRVHFTSKERYFEPPVLSIVLTGERACPHWDKKGENVDFFDLKGIIENLFAALKIENYAFSASCYSNFHPGRQAEIKITHIGIGIIGEVHPSTLKKAGLEHPVYFAELNLEELNAFQQPTIKMQPIPKYPTSIWDWTVTVAEPITAADITARIKQEQERSMFLESFSLLDVYRSDTLGSNRKNVTFRFVYRDPSKTISQAVVADEHHRITKNINEYLNEEKL